MAKIVCRQAKVDDVESFAMRPEDEDEARALGWTGPGALRSSFDRSSECWAGEIDGKVFCLLGCVPGDVGANVWMLFTDGVQTLPVEFFRKSRGHVRQMLDAYGELHSRTLPGNTFIIRWLRWLGFTREDTQPYLTFHLRGD